MTRTPILHRPAGLALCLLVLSITSSCAHFHNAEVRAQERAEGQRNVPAVADTLPRQPAAPAMAPEPAPPAPMPDAVVQAAPVPPSAATAPEPSAPLALPEASAAREPAPEPPVRSIPAPQPAPATSPTTAPAPATDDAIIIFANIPGAHCTSCETLKISVAPSGQVLIERGSWGPGHANWHYKRFRAEVSTARAAAFAASLSADRPAGTAQAGCPAPAAGDDGLSIEWIEANRHDRLTISPGCTARASNRDISRLRHAPELLGLRQLALP